MARDLEQTEAQWDAEDRALPGTAGMTCAMANPATIQTEAKDPYQAHMRQAAIYILANRRNGALYTGVTSDLSRRIFQHRQGASEGFWKRYGCVLLVYYESRRSPRGPRRLLEQRRERLDQRRRPHRLEQHLDVAAPGRQVFRGVAGHEQEGGRRAGPACRRSGSCRRRPDDNR